MLKKLLQDKNKTIYAVAKESGMSYSYLHDIINEKRSYKDCCVRIFKGIADALGISMDELYEECQKEENGNREVK